MKGVTAKINARVQVEIKHFLCIVTVIMFKNLCFTLLIIKSRSCNVILKHNGHVSKLLVKRDS